MLTAIVCLILGMGMPTVSAYLTISILVAPAVANLGVSLLATHMFMFYFALLSFVTPPVALAAYAAAGIAGSEGWETGWRSFFLTFSGFIVPFAFVMNEALLLNGPWSEILITFSTACLGVYALSKVVVGYWDEKLLLYSRVILFVSALLLIAPYTGWSIAGLILLIIVRIKWIINFFRGNKNKQAPETVQ